jgi:hypothetical protein
MPLSRQTSAKCVINILRKRMGEDDSPLEPVPFESLVFTKVTMTDQDLIRMNQLRFSAPNVKFICFLYNELTEKCLPALEQMLGRCPNLETIRLDHNRITQIDRATYPTIFRAVQMTRMSNSMDANFQNITYESASLSLNYDEPYEAYCTALFRKLNASIPETSKEIKAKISGLKEVQRIVGTWQCPNIYAWCGSLDKMVTKCEMDLVSAQKPKPRPQNRAGKSKPKPSLAKTHYCAVCNKEGYLVAMDGWTCEECLNSSTTPSHVRKESETFTKDSVSPPSKFFYFQDGVIPTEKQMSPEVRAELERTRKERRSKNVEEPMTQALSVKSKEVSTIIDLDPTNADKDKCQVIIKAEKRLHQKACPKCGHLNERSMNNNHIHCLYCNTQFCFLCIACVQGTRHFRKKCPQHGD